MLRPTDCVSAKNIKRCSNKLFLTFGGWTHVRDSLFARPYNVLLVLLLLHLTTGTVHTDKETPILSLFSPFWTTYGVKLGKIHTTFIKQKIIKGSGL